MKDLNIEFLKIIKNLGNSSLHISKDDISGELAISDLDIRKLELAFSRLLYLAYEKDAEEAAALSSLKNLDLSKK